MIYFKENKSAHEKSLVSALLRALLIKATQVEINMYLIVVRGKASVFVCVCVCVYVCRAGV